MSYLPRRKPYSQKPPAGVKPNLAHPNLKGCQYFWAINEGGNSLHSLVTPGNDSTSFAGDAEITSDRALKFSGDGLVHCAKPIGNDPEFSLAIEFEVDTYSIDQTIFSGMGDSGGKGWQVWINALNHLAFYMAGSGHTYYTSFSATSDRRVFVWRRRWNSGTKTGEMYLDGKLLTSNVYSTILTTATNTLARFGGNDNDSGTFVGRIHWAAYYPDYFIPVPQLRRLSADPWAPFSRPLPIWIPAAAGGTAVTSTLATLSITPLASSINDKTEVTSSLAALDITALQSNVNDKTEIVSGTFGSLPISALQSSINDKTQVTSTLADLPITPFSSTVSQGANITSTLGTLSITALQSSINDKTQVASSLANLPLTGYASIVAQTGDQAITSTLGQLTITTFTSTVNDKTEVTSSLGSLNLQSFASLVNDKTQVASTLATLTITPYQSTVQTAANIVSTLATLPITVFQSKVGQPTDITSTLATLSITPYASTIVDVTKIVTGNTPNLPLMPRQSIVAGEGAGGAAAQLSINSSWRRRRSH